MTAIEEGVEEDAPRVLVLGCTVPSPDVLSYLWSELPPRLNVADFDVVVVALVGLLREALPEYSRPILESLRAEDFTTHLFSAASDLIFLGDPAVLLGDAYGSVIRAIDLLPLACEAHAVDVETVSGVEADFGEHIASQSRCHFVLRGYLDQPTPLMARYMQAVDAESAVRSFHGELQPIAVSRVDWPVAAFLNFTAEIHGKPSKSGTVAWLPLEADMDAATAQVAHLLRTRYGISERLAPPPWAERWHLPRGQAVVADLQRARAAFEAQQRKIERLEGALEEEARFRGLLYETGTEVLEPLVRDALRALGAVVTEPPEKGVKDGDLVVDGVGYGVLEIKGLKNALGKSDVRELQDWVTAEIEREPDWNGRGLLVFNSWREIDPDERRDPVGSNALPLAERWNLILLRAEDLWEALRQLQAGGFEPMAWWQSVLAWPGGLWRSDQTPDGPSTSGG